MLPLLFDALTGAMRAGRLPREIVMGASQLVQLRRDADARRSGWAFLEYCGERASRYGGYPIRIEGALDGWRIESEHAP